jgi:hypothetical protein
MSMPDEYRPDQIFPTAVPQWRQLEDGTWLRDWEILLASAPDERGLEHLDHLAEMGIDITATLSTDRRTMSTSNEMVEQDLVLISRDNQKVAPLRRGHQVR